MHFGHNEARLQALQADFVRWFRDNVTAFPLVQERLTTYLLSSDADIWLITGSPQPLVEAVYFDTPCCRGLIYRQSDSAWLWWLGIDDALSGT